FATSRILAGSMVFCTFAHPRRDSPGCYFRPAARSAAKTPVTPRALLSEGCHRPGAAETDRTARGPPRGDRPPEATRTSLARAWRGACLTSRAADGSQALLRPALGLRAGGDDLVIEPQADSEQETLLMWFAIWLRNRTPRRAARARRLQG